MAVRDPQTVPHCAAGHPASPMLFSQRGTRGDQFVCPTCGRRIEVYPWRDGLQIVVLVPSRFENVVKH